jgi:pilus assembly protein Flp/PilA
MTSKINQLCHFDLKRLLPGRRQEGQGMVEYALILVLISVVVIVILITMGAQIHNVFVNVAKAMGVPCSVGQCR